jgi:hypothetical protein
LSGANTAEELAAESCYARGRDGVCHNVRH